MNFLETCLNYPPTVGLSASFTLAIFSHFANLPTRWQGAGKLLKVLGLQMSGPDVLLFLERACECIFICLLLFVPIQILTIPLEMRPVSATYLNISWLEVYCWKLFKQYYLQT